VLRPPGIVPSKPSEAGLRGAQGGWRVPQGQRARQNSPLLFSVEKTLATRSYTTADTRPTMKCMLPQARAIPRYTPFRKQKGVQFHARFEQNKTPHHKGEGLLLHDVRFAYPLADGVTTPGYQLPLVASSGGRRYPIHRSP